MTDVFILQNCLGPTVNKQTLETNKLLQNLEWLKLDKLEKVNNK